MTRKRVVIAGGSGFVGRALARSLQNDYTVVILTRQERISHEKNIIFKRCDMFSLKQIEEALKGADFAIYLVHSMSANSRLTQSDFADLDLIVSDNFARACNMAAIRQIVYLGGLVPEADILSHHLQSRLEVEKSLASKGTPLTTLRAGLVIGKGGSSYRILMNLVRRLPLMVLPAWTNSKTQPVTLDDTVKAIKESLGNKELFGQILDIGSFEVMSYAEMMKRTAKALDKKAFYFSVPFSSSQLSKLWVKTFSGAPWSLVSPLVESLKHHMVVRHGHFTASGISFEDAIRKAENGEISSPNLNSEIIANASLKLNTVRSIQRLPVPSGRSANWLTLRYATWLQKVFSGFLTIKIQRQREKIRFEFMGICLLELALSTDRSNETRFLYYISGGKLVDPRTIGIKGRLEFRVVLREEVALSAIHDFIPNLPWPIYKLTQAPVHLLVMHLFKQYLQQYSNNKKKYRPGV